MEGLAVGSMVPLAPRTRLGLGGPADLFVETGDLEALIGAVAVAREAGAPVTVLGGGTNVVASDRGARGVVLRYVADRIRVSGNEIEADAGAALQDVVDAANAAGLSGLQTLTRIPGALGGALFGNAGAYGRELAEVHVATRCLDDGVPVWLSECGFEYRGSIFQKRSGRIILGCRLRLPPGDPGRLAAESRDIAAVRDAKFPPEMRSAGSIFRNVRLADLPAVVADRIPEPAVRGGKVASAWFLERVGAKGMRRGGVEVAPWHANLIHNLGGGTAAELRGLAFELKRRVRGTFGFDLREEVRYLGEFEDRGDGAGISPRTPAGFPPSPAPDPR